MRIAHIIICHEDPASVERLLRALHHPDFDFYLHLDKKTDMAPFRYLSNFPNTFFVQRRIAVRWGGYSQTEAAISAIDDILASGRSYDFVNLLSGQDYPIKPVQEIRNVLQAYRGYSLMQCEPPPSPWWDVAVARFKRYHLTDYGFKGRYRLAEVLSKLLPARSFPLPLQLYGGPDAAYWLLTIDAARYVRDILAKKDKIWWFFKHTWGSDEFVISTLLMNSSFRENIIQENYHYMDRSIGGSRPKILTLEDFPALKRSVKLFARKFSRTTDAVVLDKIDTELLFAESRGPALKSVS